MILITDIETTGLDHDNCEVISIGAQAIKFTGEKRWTLTNDTFYETGNVSNLAKIEDTALDINGFALGELTSQGQENTDMYKHFYTWTKELQAFDLAGVNIGAFDVPFLRILHDKTFNKGKTKVKWPFGYRFLEIGSVYFNVSNQFSINPCGFKEMMEYTNVENYKLHHALQDAIAEAKVLVRLLNTV